MAELKTKYLPDVDNGNSENFDASVAPYTNYAWNVYGDSAANLVTLNTNGGTVYTCGGADLVTVNGAATVYGGDAADVISIVAGANTVSGEAGDDIVNVGGAAVNTVYGGAGVDRVSITGSGNNTVYGDAGADVISIGAVTGANIVYGGADADTISVLGTGGNTIYGDAGADLITVAAAAAAGKTNNIYGGTGSDTICLTAAATGVEQINYAAADGADVVAGFAFATDKVKFTDVTGETLAKATYTFTNSGAVDTLSTVKVQLSSGNTLTVDGIAGAVGGDADDAATDFADVKNLTGASFVTSDATTVVYVNGATQVASSANAYVRGLSAGGNELDYAATGKMYIGDAGTDAIDLKAATAATTIDLTDTTKFVSIENVTNTAGAGTGVFTLRGTTGANALTGGTAADFIWGRAGDDTLTGLAGDDTFYAGISEGNDTVTDAIGAAGNDTVKLYNVAFSDIVSVVDTGADADTKITFTGSADTLTITGGEADAANSIGKTKFVLKDGTIMKIAQQDANQKLVYASDVGIYYAPNTAVAVDASAQTAGVTINLYDSTKYKNITEADGGSGDDVLRGRNYGADTLVGNAGADQLWGGTGGSDTMTGGTGNNTFYFGKTDGFDTITDIKATDTVKLWNVALSDIAAVSDTGADLEMTFVNNSADKLILTNMGAAGTTAKTSYQLQDGTTFKIATDNVYDSAAKFYVDVPGTGILNATAATAGVTINGYDTVTYGTTFATINSGSGNDTLRGRYNQNDTLSAGDGNNSLWGASGNDTMTAGVGTDTYYWGRADGNDTITVGSDSKDKVMLYTSGLTTSNVTIGVTGGVLTLTTDAGNTLQLGTTNAWSVGGTNTFVFGYSATADNTYKIVQSGSTYAWEKVTA